jgi:hypothetical protein
MISLSHWGLFCPPAGLSWDTLCEIIYLKKSGLMSVPCAPREFCFGPPETWKF